MNPICPFNPRWIPTTPFPAHERVALERVPIPDVGVLGKWRVQPAKVWKV